MLTKDDLTAIRGVVKEEVRTEVVRVVKKEMKDEVTQVVKEELEGPLRAVEKGFGSLLKKELKPIHQKLNKLDKKIDLIARVLDRDIVDLQKRTGRIEEHLHLVSLN